MHVISVIYIVLRRRLRIGEFMESSINIEISAYVAQLERDTKFFGGFVLKSNGRAANNDCWCLRLVFQPASARYIVEQSDMRSSTDEKSGNSIL